MNGQNGQKGGIGVAGFFLLVFIGLYFIQGSMDADGALKSIIHAAKIVAIVGIYCVTALILAAIIAAVIVKRKEQKLKEEEQKAAILNAPLQTFADLETQQLMDKYDGKEPGQNEALGDNGKKPFVNPYSVSGNPYEEEGKQVQSH